MNEPADRPPVPLPVDSPVVDPFPLQVLLEDGPLLAVSKPAGLLTQGVPAGLPTLEAQVRAFLKEKYHKPGNVYLGIPHRIDRPVSGVVVFARNSKAAARLAEQFRNRQVRKIYWGIVEHPPEPAEGTLVDWLLKVPDQAQVEVVPPETPGAREARLTYRTLGSGPAGCLVEITLETGRMHQIRVQFASRGWPIVGDRQYGAAMTFGSHLPGNPSSDATDAVAAVDGYRQQPIALHARHLTLLHPVRYDEVTITAPLPEGWPG